MHVDGWIFVVQPMQSRVQLLLVGAGGRAHGELHHRLGECERRNTNGMFLGGERVVGVRIAQLRHTPDVSRMQVRHLNALPTRRHGEMPQLLRAVARGVVDVLTADDAPRQHTEVAHIPHMRFGQRLEDEGGEWAGVLGMQLHRPVPFCTGERMDFLHLKRARHELHEFRQQRAHTDQGF